MTTWTSRAPSVLNSHGRIAVNAALTVGLLATFWVTRTSSWQGSIELHTLMELAATLLAAMIGVVGLIQFYSKKSITFLFIGTGFAGTALLDGYHGVVTSAWFGDLWPSPPPHLVPWSWSASRTFLSLLLLLSLWGWVRERGRREAEQFSEQAVFWTTGALTLICFFFFAFVPLPAAYYPDLFFGRPGELVAALFFGIALAGYLWKGAWRTDRFEHSLVLSLILGVVSQALVMPLSFRLFDSMFDLAHVLKILSYLLVLVGLFSRMLQLFRQAEASATELAQANRELQEQIAVRHQAEAELQELNATLESRVAERTREAERSRSAALNMMQDAQEARRTAEAAEARVRSHAIELERSNADLESFAYVASHDLKSPLRAIDTLVKWLAEDLDAVHTEKTRQYMERLQGRVLRMESLIDGLLRYSRAGVIDTDREEVAIGELLDEICGMLNIPEGFSVRYPDRLPKLRTPKTPLQQVLLNLIGNAIKHHDQPNGRIEVVCRENGSFLEFSVADDGPGIPEEYSEKVFQVFQTLKPRDQMEATGIGLALVKRIVERMGGKVELISRDGRGSDFRFQWPKECSRSAE